MLCVSIAKSISMIAAYFFAIIECFIIEKYSFYDCYLIQQYLDDMERIVGNCKRHTKRHVNPKEKIQNTIAFSYCMAPLHTQYALYHH